MLKKRIIATLILKDNWVVQSIGFKRYLPIGSLNVSLEYLNKWGVDEIIVMDIDASKDNRGPNLTAISSASKFIQTPLALGGGISSIDDMIKVIKAGADKVVINTEFLKNPRIVSEGAKYFGNQCIVVSIDVKKKENGEYQIYNRNIDCSNIQIEEALKEAQSLGAGEIFVNSVDKDGMKNGYDLNLFKTVKKFVNIPIIFCGGIGNIEHILDGIRAGISAPAIGNYFHFSEMSVILTKDILREMNIDVRRDTYARFHDINFDRNTFKIKKIDDKILNDMRFQSIPEEVI